MKNKEILLYKTNKILLNHLDKEKQIINNLANFIKVLGSVRNEKNIK